GHAAQPLQCQRRVRLGDLHLPDAMARGEARTRGILRSGRPVRTLHELHVRQVEIATVDLVPFDLLAAEIDRVARGADRYAQAAQLVLVPLEFSAGTLPVRV